MRLLTPEKAKLSGQKRPRELATGNGSPATVNASKNAWLTIETFEELNDVLERPSDASASPQTKETEACVPLEKPKAKEHPDAVNGSPGHQDTANPPLKTYKLRRKRKEAEEADTDFVPWSKSDGWKAAEAESSTPASQNAPQRTDRVLRERNSKKGKYEMPVEVLEICQAEPWDMLAEASREQSPPAAAYPGEVGDGGVGKGNCKICGKPEDRTSTLLCDRCNSVFHLQCVGVVLSEEDDERMDEWLCEPCARRKEEQGSTLIFEGLEQNEEYSLPEGAMGEDTRRQDANGAHLNAPSEQDRWLLRGDHSLYAKVRIGPKYQACVPEWTGHRQEDDVDKDRPRFGEEVALSEEEKAALAREEEMKRREDNWPSGWLPAKKLAEGTAENWLQCTRVLYKEGDVRPDGKKSRKQVECGKWRRAPLDMKGAGNWECSCAVVWDPKHADCNVPQELPKREIDRRVKAAAQAAAKKDQKDGLKSEQGKNGVHIDLETGKVAQAVGTGSDSGPQELLPGNPKASGKPCTSEGGKVEKRFANSIKEEAQV